MRRKEGAQFSFSLADPPLRNERDTKKEEYKEPLQLKIENIILSRVYLVCCSFGFIGLAVLLSQIVDADPIPAPPPAEDAAAGAAFPEAVPSGHSCPVDITQTLPRELEAMRGSVRKSALALEPVSWDTYSTDPAQFAGRHVLLGNDDFAAGTVRIRSGGLFTLQDDVTFSPNPNHDHMPDLPRQSDLYGGRAYQLGFFAAVTVEAPDVVIDLNGHTLQQSRVFAAEQRFYATIELADQPFVTGQGPVNFGFVNTAANGLVVENGTLGLTSHHALHGNGARRVLVQDVTFHDYEIASLALNGVQNAVFRRLNATGTRSDVPVLGTYSNARLVRATCERVAGAVGVVPQEERARVAAALWPLQQLLTQAKGDITRDGRINATAHPTAWALFANPTGLFDGGVYGMLLHPIGMAVNAFWHLQTPPAGSPGAVERILVDNCTVRGTQSSTVEVVALVAPNGMPVRGPVGEILRFRDNLHGALLYSGPDTGPGPWNGGNALANVHIALLRAMHTVSNETARRELFGTLNGDEHVVRWARGEINLSDLITQHGYSYQRNTDTMFHVNKGVVAVRIDGARDVCVRNLAVLDTANHAAAPITKALPGERDDEEASYMTGADGGHPSQGPQYGYLGADARGFSAAGTHNLHIEGLVVDGVHAHCGNARGLDFFNFANQTHSGPRCAVHNVTALTANLTAVHMGHAMMGPKVAQAIGVRASSSSAQSIHGMGSVRVGNVVSMALEQAVFLAVDATPEHAAVELTPAESVNSYGLQ